MPYYQRTVQDNDAFYFRKQVMKEIMTMGMCKSCEENKLIDCHRIGIKIDLVSLFPLFGLKEQE